MSREWTNSKVMTEFLKVAEKSGLISPDLKQDGVGNPKEKIDEITRNEPTEDYKIKTEDLVDKAHPEPAWVNEKSMGEGSLVENVKEQQEKDIDIITKMPRGTLIGVHAELVENLVKLANFLENENRIKEVERIDETIKKISTLYKQSGWFLVPSLLLGGFTGAKMFGHMLTSKQENLLIDMNDFYDKLLDYKDRSASANKAAEIIEPFLSRLEKADFSSKENSDEYAKIIIELRPVMRQLKTLVKTTRLDIKERSSFLSKLWGEVKDFFGFEDYKLLSAKFDDLEESYNITRKFVSSAKSIEREFAGKEEVFSKASPVESILSKSFLGKRYGNLQDLENSLNSTLKELYEKGKFKKLLKANIVSDGKIVGNSQDIIQILDIVERNMIG